MAHDRVVSGVSERDRVQKAPVHPPTENPIAGCQPACGVQLLIPVPGSGSGDLQLTVSSRNMAEREFCARGPESGFPAVSTLSGRDVRIRGPQESVLPLILC